MAQLGAIPSGAQAASGPATVALVPHAAFTQGALCWRRLPLRAPHLPSHHQTCTLRLRDPVRLADRSHDPPRPSQPRLRPAPDQHMTAMGRGHEPHTHRSEAWMHGARLRQPQAPSSHPSPRQSPAPRQHSALARPLLNPSPPHHRLHPARSASAAPPCHHRNPQRLQSRWRQQQESCPSHPLHRPPPPPPPDSVSHRPSSRRGPPGPRACRRHADTAQSRQAAARNESAET